MTKYSKVAGSTRVVKNIPKGYDGQLFYREITDVKHVYKDFLDRRVDAERWVRLGKCIGGGGQLKLKPGTVVDDGGSLLPEWQVPLKMQVTVDGPLPQECILGAWVSERVWDVIQSLEPDRHVFIPVDGTRPGGEVERFYAMRWGESYLPNEPPVLHPEYNNLRRFNYSDGRTGFTSQPGWGDDNGAEFAYLDASVVEGRHLFTSELVDNSPILSGVMFDRLTQIGPIATKWDLFAPLGGA